MAHKKLVYLNSNQMELYLNKKHLNKNDADDWLCWWS